MFVTIKHVTFGASINLPPLFPSPSLFLLEAGTTQHSITSSCLYLTHPLHYYVIANRYYDWLVSKSEMCFPIKSPDWPKLTTINIHSSHCYHKTSLHPNLLVYSSMSLNCSKRKGQLKGVDLNQKALLLRVLFCELRGLIRQARVGIRG